MVGSKGHFHFFSAVVFVLAIIGAVQVVHWYREHTLWRNALATFQEVNQQVRVLMGKVGCLDEYDESVSALLEALHDNPEALESMERVIKVLTGALEKISAYRTSDQRRLKDHEETDCESPGLAVSDL